MKITESKLRQMIRGIIREASSGGGTSKGTQDTTDKTDAAASGEPRISSKATKGSKYWYNDPSAKKGSGQDGKPAIYYVKDWGSQKAEPKKAAVAAQPAQSAVPANKKTGAAAIPARAAIAAQPAQPATIGAKGHNAYSADKTAAKDTDSEWQLNPDYQQWEREMADAEAADADANAETGGGQGDTPSGGGAGASTGGKKGKKSKKKKDDK